MSEKVSKGLCSSARSCNYRRSTAEAVRVVHISNPTIMVETSASEFRAVVQSLTGRKGSSPSSIQHEEINLYSDNQNSPQDKGPRLLVEELRCLNDMKPSESAIIHDNSTASHCRNDRDDVDVSISEGLGLEVQHIQNPNYILSQYQVWETLESIGDTRNIVFDIFSPSILFSEFGYL